MRPIRTDALLELELELELVSLDFGLDEFVPDAPRIATPPGAGAGRASGLLVLPLTLDPDPDFVDDEVRPTLGFELPPPDDDDDDDGGGDERSTEPAPPPEELLDPPELVAPPLDAEPELVVPAVRGTACAAASAGTTRPSATASVAIR